MVGKLMKHELYALFRIILWISIAVVLFAVISRLLLSETIVQTAGSAEAGVNLLLVTVLLIAFYMFSIGALVIAAWAVSVSRFYKSLFTGEGYMTLALPVTADQIIWAKLLSALIAMFYAAVVSVGSLFILFAGTVGDAIDLGGLLEELGAIIQEMTAVDALLIVEEVLLCIVSIPMSILLLYAGMSMGQFFTSHRTGMILLIFGALYIVVNVISVVGVMPFFTYLEANVAGAAHIINWIRIAFIAAVDVGCFFLVRYILRNKVNLIA